MKFATPTTTVALIALATGTGAAAFVPSSCTSSSVRSEIVIVAPLASSYLDDLGRRSSSSPSSSSWAPQQQQSQQQPPQQQQQPVNFGSGIPSYLDGVGVGVGSSSIPASSSSSTSQSHHHNHALGSGGMVDTRNPEASDDVDDPRKSISASPSFDEYMKQRDAAEAFSSGAAGAPEEVEPAQASSSYISGRQQRERSSIINRNSNGYLDTLSTGGGSGGMWTETAAAAAWEKKGGDERAENGNSVERTPVNEVVEERREAVEERREAVVADATMEGEKQPVEARNIARKEGGAKRLGYTAPSSAALGDFLVQRAIQQQLYYSAQLGNEPMVHWLKRFRSHEHLDSIQRGEGRCGFPGTYSATFDQLNTLPFTAYLDALGNEPNSSMEVSFVKPQRRLSARERANPYLNNQPPVIEIYDQPIITSDILKQLLNTADALVETWAFHFHEAESNDLARLANDRALMKGLPSAMMLEHAALVKGGETAYSRLTGDEAMPLYAFDCRACDRFDTLRALSLLIDEVDALTPETAFDVAYLRCGVPEEDDDEMADLGVNELILKRRKARRAKFEQGFVIGDDIAKGKAARTAALSFLQKFCNEWVPKLVKGDARSSLVKGEYRHAPGMKEVRPEDAGVDADEVFEALWEYEADEGVQKMLGGELVLPGLMGERLREIRAAVAVESRGALMELVKPELRKARIQYTDFVEEDSDGMGTYERFHFQAKVDGSENEAYSNAAIIAEMSIDM